MYNLIILSITSVLVTTMIDDFMQKGMIFRSYKYWLTFITLRKKIFPFLYKPLGGCLPCTNIMVFISFAWLFYNAQWVWFLIVGAALSQWILKTADRYEIL